MLNPHTADLKEVDDPVFVGEMAHHLDLLGRFDVFGRGEVVGDQVDLFFVENFFDPDLLKLFDRRGGGDVVPQDKVQFAIDQLAGKNIFLAGVFG